MSERDRNLRVTAITLIAGLGLAACTSGGSTVSSESSTSSSSSASPTAPHAWAAVCAPFDVYAQNRWSAVPGTNEYGAAERSRPDKLAPQIGSYAGNQLIVVDGWVHTGKSVYPTNTPPWNSDIWFHEANLKDGQDAWVSFAGVRGEQTTPDPTGRADGGKPAPTPADCEGLPITN